MTEQEDFMDSYAENDEIKTFIEETLKDKHIEAIVEYHYYSDGKHRVELIECNDEEHENKFIQVKASITREDLKNQLLEMFKEEDYKQWIIKNLEEWRETFRDEEIDEETEEDENLKGWENITRLITRTKNDTLATKTEYEEVLFHLWQHIKPKLDELEDIQEQESKQWNDKCPKCKSDKVDWVDSSCCESETWNCLNCNHIFNLRLERTLYYEDE